MATKSKHAKYFLLRMMYVLKTTKLSLTTKLFNTKSFLTKYFQCKIFSIYSNYLSCNDAGLSLAKEKPMTYLRHS